MILRLFRPSVAAATIDMLYGAIVAQARLPMFYEEFGVSDTVEGRFEMILLHLALLLRRFKQEAQGAELGQAVFEAFCRDMDGNLREMGVGDLTVPKKMKRFAEAFYGRLKAYDEAMSGNDPAALKVSIERNVFSSVMSEHDHAEWLAAYARRAAARLDSVDGSCFSRGLLAFPLPQADLDCVRHQHVAAR